MFRLFVVLVVALLAGVEAVIWAFRRGHLPRAYVMTSALFSLSVLGGFVFTATGI